MPLREQLHLPGTEKACDHGQGGACTVIVDGQSINACLSLAVMHQAAMVTTIEGLGTPEHLHPMQAAFVKHDGFQCGYCTSGQICSAVARRRRPEDIIALSVPAWHAEQDGDNLAAPACLEVLNTLLDSRAARAIAFAQA